MPHNLYLHSALVQSRNVDRSRPRMVRQANFYLSIEAAVALGVSFFINLAVVSVFAKGFFNPTCAESGQAWVRNEDTDVYECGSIGLQGAGEALRSLLGNSASIVWAVGLLAAGQSSTMTGTFSGQFVMEGFLTIKLAPWKRVAITRSIALVPAIIVALMATSPSTGDTLDEYLNLLQSVQLPFALLPILHFTNSKRIMGGDFVNSPRFKIFGWFVTILICGINFYLIGSQILNFSVSGLPDTWWMYTILVILCTAYLCFICFIVWSDLAYAVVWVKKRGGWDRDASMEGLDQEYDQPEKNSPAWIAQQHARYNAVVSHGGSEVPHSQSHPGSSSLLAVSDDDRVFTPLVDHDSLEIVNHSSDSASGSASASASPSGSGSASGRDSGRGSDARNSF